MPLRARRLRHGDVLTDMATDPMDYAIVDAINRIAHILGMQTVAESVENAETLAKITALKVDYAQGYFIAQPETMVHAPTGEVVELAQA
jgi:EAL domain-containing protein (putative c-di-GMP-specific phosphodiesterase class I)